MTVRVGFIGEAVDHLVTHIRACLRPGCDELMTIPLSEVLPAVRR